MTKGIKLTFEDGVLLAEKNGGECTFNGLRNFDKWGWKCKCGNEWKTSYSSVLKGSWCPNCRHNKVTIERLREYAATKNGDCLSVKCKNIFEKVKWKCEYKHEWEAIPSNVIYKNKWCPVCSKNQKLTMDDALKTAKERNAKLISKTYINSSTKLEWECEGHHRFFMSMNSIRSKHCWCPYCHSWNAEEICRKYFETFFGCKFIKTRPAWLVNNDNNKLELDGLSDIKINGKYVAFEHNGLQHYKINYFPEEMFPTDLEKIQEHDRIKIDLCNKNNVCLFLIPHLLVKTKLKDLPTIIKQQSINFGLDVNIKDVDISDIYLLSNKLKKYNDIARNNDGYIISNTYIKNNIKIDAVCKNGHIFKISPNAMNNGNWCAECSKNKKFTIDDMIVLAENKGGKCVSSTYNNCKTKIKWRCKLGHEWEAVPYSIKAGSWCPVCEKNSRIIYYKKTMIIDYNELLLLNKELKDASNNNFSLIINKYLMIFGISQNQMAIKFGVSKTTVRSWIKGLYYPRPSLFNTIIITITNHVREESNKESLW